MNSWILINALIINGKKKNPLVNKCKKTVFFLSLAKPLCCQTWGVKTLWTYTFLLLSQGFTSLSSITGCVLTFSSHARAHAHLCTGWCSPICLTDDSPGSPTGLTLTAPCTALRFSPHLIFYYLLPFVLSCCLHRWGTRCSLVDNYPDDDVIWVVCVKGSIFALSPKWKCAALER